MSQIVIELHASDPSNNRKRAWRIVAGTDLFGLWTAHVTFGRIGSAGRTIRREFGSETDALRFLRRGLCRRGTALRRLGVPYRRVEASSAAIPLLTLSGLR